MTARPPTRPILRRLVLLFLVAQIVVPIIVLTAPRPARFGWQMFTAHAPAPLVWTEAADGSLAAVDLERLLVHPRPEADLAQALADVLCAAEDAEAVVVETPATGTRRVACP